MYDTEAGGVRAAVYYARANQDRHTSPAGGGTVRA